MRNFKAKIFMMMVGGACLTLASTAAHSQSREIINIGTAGIGGGWYPTGGYICNLVNRTRKDLGHSIRCTVESTAGTVANIRAIHRGDLEIGFSVSGALFDAYHGLGKYEALGKGEHLRFVMSFHNDYQHLVARADAGIKHFRDIKGKRINTLTAGSGSKVIAHQIMEYMGIKPEDLALETSLTNREQGQALCDGKIDAFFQETGAGASGIQEATTSCDAVIATIDGPEIDKLIADRPYFVKGVIPGGTYRGNPDDVETFAESTVLIAHKDASEEAVYYLVKSVFDNFEELKQQSALYRQMTREGAAINGSSGVPLHPGAERYFREVGLAK